jgi:hypothetical protein
MTIFHCNAYAVSHNFLSPFSHALPLLLPLLFLWSAMFATKMSRFGQITPSSFFRYFLRIVPTGATYGRGKTSMPTHNQHFTPTPLNDHKKNSACIGRCLEHVFFCHYYHLESYTNIKSAATLVRFPGNRRSTKVCRPIPPNTTPPMFLPFLWWLPNGYKKHYNSNNKTNTQYSRQTSTRLACNLGYEYCNTKFITHFLPIFTGTTTLTKSLSAASNAPLYRVD